MNAATAAKAGLRQRPVREAQEPGRRRSATAIRVKATQRIRPDCVYMVYGFGHTRAAAEALAYLKRRERRAAHDEIRRPIR